MTPDPHVSDHGAERIATLISATQSSLAEPLWSLLEAFISAGRGVRAAGNMVHAVLLLTTRIWLSQAILVHQIAMMMHAEGFAEVPSSGPTLVRTIVPLLLATGLLTRPLALILVFGVAQGLTDAQLDGPRTILLIWLVMAGAGPLSLDFFLRSGLSRVPVWAVRTISRLYAGSNALAEFLLPFGTRIFLAFVFAGGTGFAVWRMPLTGALVTAPGWLLLLCWTLMLGIATRPVAVLLCALAPPILVSGRVPDQFEISALLLLLASKGAGLLSLDHVATLCAAAALPSRDQLDKALPHVVIVGGGFAGIAAARGLRHTRCRITLIDRRNHYLFQPLLYQVATAALSPTDIAIPIRSILRDQRNVAVRLGEVVGVDQATRAVLLQGERVRFDYLILATGARHSYFGRD
jgi:NADH dehydrogenase/putative oxidoreductase